MKKIYIQPQTLLYQISLMQPFQAGSDNLGNQGDSGGDYTKSAGGIDWDQFDDEEDKE